MFERIVSRGTLTTVAVEIEAERQIDEEGDIDAAEGVTNKAIRLY